MKMIWKKWCKVFSWTISPWKIEVLALFRFQDEMKMRWRWYERSDVKFSLETFPLKKSRFYRKLFYVQMYVLHWLKWLAHLSNIYWSIASGWYLPRTLAIIWLKPVGLIQHIAPYKPPWTYKSYQIIGQGSTRSFDKVVWQATLSAKR